MWWWTFLWKLKRTLWKIKNPTISDVKFQTLCVGHFFKYQKYISVVKKWNDNYEVFSNNVICANWYVVENLLKSHYCKMIKMNVLEANIQLKKYFCMNLTANDFLSFCMIKNEMGLKRRGMRVKILWFSYNKLRLHSIIFLSMYIFGWRTIGRILLKSANV
jgi:hypothetical protein